MKKNETYAEWLRRKQSEHVAYKYMNEKDLRKEYESSVRTMKDEESTNFVAKREQLKRSAIEPSLQALDLGLTDLASIALQISEDLDCSALLKTLPLLDNEGEKEEALHDFCSKYLYEIKEGIKELARANYKSLFHKFDLENDLVRERFELLAHRGLKLLKKAVAAKIGINSGISNLELSSEGIKKTRKWTD